MKFRDKTSHMSLISYFHQYLCKLFTHFKNILKYINPMAFHLSETSLQIFSNEYEFSLRKGTFILNKIKIVAADTSRPKMKITVAKNISF